MTALITRLLSRIRRPAADATRTVREIERPSAAWIARRILTGATYVEMPQNAVINLGERWPTFRQHIIDSAERAIRHEFDLLGSGRFVPRDPERTAQGDYQPIDWYLDPVRQLRFPRGVPHKAWKLYEMRPGNADVKYPWELARCQHWVTLGQAFLLTEDERFAQEIASELDDFLEANPVGIGVNWTCTMDVGLRAVNWVIALDEVRQSARLDAAFWTRAYNALFDHGLFIRDNLENTYEVTSNHFLSNVVGLWFLAAVFSDLPEGREWKAFARQALEQEILVQVLSDGADFESSVPYHRLVTELFLASLRLGDVTGEPLSVELRAKVRNMVAYLAAVLRPDGLMPQVGDADDGRVHQFGGVGSATPQDARHLLGPAGMMFDEPAWLAMGGAAAQWEAGWWGFDVPQTPAARPAPVVRLFPDAGIAVARRDGQYLLITNGVVGTKGFGNHKHNDQLSFEYHVAGVPVVVDPGSYVYTSDPAARNLFRSTASHNTVQVDGAEQNEMNPEWIFRLFEKAHGEHIAFAGTEVVEYAGRHVGYERLESPVSHERRFRFDLSTGDLDITDVLAGRGRRRLKWHFHFAPGIRVELRGSTEGAATGAGVCVRLTWPAGFEAAVAGAFYSPSYGVRTPCQALDLDYEAHVDAGIEYTFSFRTIRSV